MDIAGRIVVVTGGADGIGRALALGAKKRGAKAVVVADLNEAGAKETARMVGGHAFACDVAREADIQRVVAETEAKVGPIALFCSNAGVGNFGGTPYDVASASNAQWQRGWEINVMAHVYAARALVPLMIARGGGYFLNTVSAAGVLNQIGSAVYGTTKHAAIGFAENLAFTHRDQGIRASVLCPQGVDTALLRAANSSNSALIDGVITPEQCASAGLDGVEKETFCILPHPQVLQYMRNKTADYDRWIGGMSKLQRALREKKA
jgi:NAD(P)-dependent dehydrogenase (short-subunit alcohol dehydrogenase family)